MIIKKTIVILYDVKDKFIADAFKTNVLMNNPNYYVVTVDNNNYLFSGTYKTKKAILNFSEAKIPALYSFFDNAKNIRTASKIRKARAKLKKPEDVKVKPYSKLLNDHLSHMFNIFNRYNTEMVICMSPVALHMAVNARKILNSKAVVAAFLPEVVFNKEFVSYDCDRFFVINDENRKHLLKYGISEDKIFITGMPPVKVNNENDLELKKKLGINNDLPIIYLTAGRLGYNTIYEYFIELIKDTDNFNLIVNTGKNIKAKKYIKAMNTFNAKNVFIVNEENEVNYIDIANLVIIQPRISDVYQCFIKGIPSVFIKPLTHLQRENQRHFIEEEVITSVNDPVNIGRDVVELLNENKLKEIKKSIDKQLGIY
jgi:UDP-N-acetylglucosamine:LPS N-acetylglucosamine transferase